MFLEVENHALFYLRAQSIWGKLYSREEYEKLKRSSDTLPGIFVQMLKKLSDKLLQSFLSEETFEIPQKNPRKTNDDKVFDAWLQLYTPEIHEQFVRLPESTLELSLFVVSILVMFDQVEKFFACEPPPSFRMATEGNL